MYQMYERSHGKAALRAHLLGLGDMRVIQMEHIPAKMSGLVFGMDSYGLFRADSSLAVLAVELCSVRHSHASAHDAVLVLIIPTRVPVHDRN